MILDSVDAIGRYGDIAALRAVIDYVQRHEVASLPDGRTDIDGDRLFCTVQSYAPKDASDARAETHRRYADLQYVLSGAERIGYSRACGEPVESDPEKDIWFYPDADMTQLLLDAGMFAVFFPGEAHAPCIMARPGLAVRKAVFKIQMSA